MDTSEYSRATLLASEGRFLEALASLPADARHSCLEERVLRAELLERTGHLQSAEQVAMSVQRLCPEPRLHARTQIVLGLIAKKESHFRAAVDYFTKAEANAAKAHDTRISCWARLRLMTAVLDDVGPDAASALIADARRSVWSSGDATLITAFHLFRCEIETTLGRLHIAQRELDLAVSLLKRYPNRWLQGLAATTGCCIHYVAGDHAAAMRYAREALECGTVSGHARTLCAAFVNLASLFIDTGRFDDANDCLSRGLRTVPPGSQAYLAFLDTKAELALARNDLDACEQCLQEGNALLRTKRVSQVDYQRRWGLCTQVRLLLRRHDFATAAGVARQGLAIAAGSGHDGLDQHFRLMLAEAAARNGRPDEFGALLCRFAATGSDSLARTAAYYWRLCAIASSDTQLSADGADCFDRSLRYSRSYADAVGNAEVVHDYAQALGGRLGIVTNTLGPSHAERGLSYHSASFVVCLDKATSLAAPSPSTTADSIRSVTALIDAAECPELLAHEVTALLHRSHCTDRFAIVTREAGRPPHVLAFSGCDHEQAAAWAMSRPKDTIVLGSSRGRSFELLALPRTDLVAATVYAECQRIVAAAIALAEASRAKRDRVSGAVDDSITHSADGVFASERMLELVGAARRLADLNITVLITGETGTGKEVLARFLHRSGARAMKPFIPFNCTSVPRDLMDSQLFGYRRGAFTGATESFQGVIRSCEGGTIFLDEVGELSAEVQPKLLRFLDSSEIHPLGASQPIRVDVRVVAATNADLEQLVSDGRFREDLYYRLNVVRLSIPPLRDRREEIPLLVQHFIELHGREFGRLPLVVADSTMEYLVLYPWPGNVRELSSEVRRLAAMSEPGAVLRPEHLSPRITLQDLTRHRQPEDDDTQAVISLTQSHAIAVAQLERALIGYALKTTGGHLSEAARQLKLSRKGLYLKRQRLNV